jgi:3-oxochol-4-en-24-oyl-CoA dehydrogenase
VSRQRGNLVFKGKIPCIFGSGDRIVSAEDIAGAEIATLIRESTAAYVANEGTLARVRRIRKGADPVDPAIWRGMADLGWTGMLAPEVAGGGALDLDAAAVLHEELGRGLVPEPLALGAHLAALALKNAASPAAEMLLASLVAGEGPCPLAWQGRAGSLSVEETQLRAEALKSRIALVGEARFVPAAAHVRWLLVAARTDAGIALYRVASKAAGLRIVEERLADASRVATLLFDRVIVEAEDLVIAPGEAAAATDRALDATRVILAAELVGLMRAGFALTLDYLRTRKQFGRAIGSFQALQHRAVDLHVEIELAGMAVADAVAQFARTSDPLMRALAASGAKARASDAALRVTREMVQLHGAIGYTDEHDAGLYLARAMTLAAMLGNASAHRSRYGAIVSRSIAA